MQTVIVNNSLLSAPLGRVGPGSLGHTGEQETHDLLRKSLLEHVARALPVRETCRVTQT